MKKALVAYFSAEAGTTRRIAEGLADACGRIVWVEEECMIWQSGYFSLDQILCMSTDYYQRCYPETRGCSGWKNRAWNNKNQAVRLVLYPILCAIQAYLFTKRGSRK